MESAISDRKVKEAMLRRSTQTWRRESASWAPAPPDLSDGEILVRNLKHGPNILTLEAGEFPPYADIRPEHLERGIVWMGKLQGNELWDLYQEAPYYAQNVAWQSIMHPIEVLTDKVERAFGTIKHIKDVMDNSPSMQKIWKYCLFIRWRCLQRTRQSERFLPHFKRLLVDNGEQNEAQRRAVASQLVFFEHDGVNLQECGWQKDKDDPATWLAFISARNNIFNMSQDWETNIDNDMRQKAFLVRKPEEVLGVPAYVLEDAADAARQAGYPKATAEAGPWLLTLDDAMLGPVLKHAKGRTFREYAYAARARVAFLGGAGAGDNTPVLMTMLQERKKYANLLGYSSWADLSFTMKMASPKQAYAFLSRLRRESLPKARRELRELQEFANSQGAQYELDHFDVDYWRERLIEKKFSLHAGYLREFFPAPAVFDGLFQLVQRLFGVQVVAADGEAQVWDKHVRFFRMRDEQTGEVLASFFLDPYRRRGKKRPGFWVDKIQEYSPVLGSERFGPRRPAVHVICDFASPQADGRPVLLSHGEVAKLFHFMGKALRHLLCNQTEGLVAGTNGMELDVQDVPAYFLERWAYDKDTLRSISRNVETGDPLPDPAIDTIAAARTFHNGMAVLKRTAIAQIDLDLHAQYDPSGQMGVFDVAKLIEAEFAVIPPRVEDHELCSLPINGERGSGIWASLWAEALAADVFVEFEKAGLENTEAVMELGRRFRRTLLAPGAGRAPAAAFYDFHGRQATFGAFLRHLGLEEAASGGGYASPAVEYEDVYEEDDDYVEFEEEGEGQDIDFNYDEEDVGYGEEEGEEEEERLDENGGEEEAEGRAG